MLTEDNVRPLRFARTSETGEEEMLSYNLACVEAQNFIGKSQQEVLRAAADFLEPLNAMTSAISLSYTPDGDWQLTLAYENV